MKKYLFLIITVVAVIFLGLKLNEEKSSAATKIEFNNLAEDNTISAADENISTDEKVAADTNPSVDESTTETSSGNSVSSSKVFMTSEFLDSDLLKISVNTADIEQPVLGLAFHLSFDPQKLHFLRYDPGEFLETGGDPFYLVALSEQ